MKEFLEETFSGYNETIGEPETKKGKFLNEGDEDEYRHELPDDDLTLHEND